MKKGFEVLRERYDQMNEAMLRVHPSIESRGQSDEEIDRVGDFIVSVLRTRETVQEIANKIIGEEDA